MDLSQATSQIFWQATHCHQIPLSEPVLQLIGLRVAVQISDPWEFGTEIGTHPISAVIEQVFCSRRAWHGRVVRDEQILLRVEKPFAFKNHKCEFFLGSCRHEGDTLAILLDSLESVPCGFTRVPAEDASSDMLFTAEHFDPARRFGLIGSVARSK
jgi:hypothetical protein